MAKKIKVVNTEVIDERYGDEGIVTRDRDLTNDEIQEIYDKAKEYKMKSEEAKPIDAPDTPAPPHKKGKLKLRCACGRVNDITEEIIEDGLSWSMIVGNDHYLTLHCDECSSQLTMYIEEITGDELSEEGDKK